MIPEGLDPSPDDRQAEEKDHGSHSPAQMENRAAAASSFGVGTDRHHTVAYHHDSLAMVCRAPNNVSYAC